ncbi:hypothetical protein N7478_002681 [Penicillium angulare]|uniref:uncharacterized protein n=1 Tax=Penicillium angulare TaxID=116970 RepID=UPI00253FD92C|nr:uncharacterized protein N7478_002681 [Penicillium angulare]KAJ5286995.1 hypothetical protein N7478_002681 [Penicillium angulare]
MSASSRTYGWPRRKSLLISAALLITSILLLLVFRDSVQATASSSFDSVTSFEFLHNKPDSQASAYSTPSATHLPAESQAAKASSLNPFTSSPGPSSGAFSSSHSSSSITTLLDLPLGIFELIKPHIHSITAESFTSRTGKTYQLPSSPKFTKPLRKNVLIMDVESRDLGGPGGLLDESTLTTDTLEGLTFGRLNHYMFAKLHGYDYKLVQLPDDPTLHGTWHKVPAMREAIKKYDWVVFMDGDAIFTHLHLPIEWLFNRWGITENITLALAEDPERFTNMVKGDPNLNTGVIVAHKTQHSEELFEAWMSCPDEKRYEGCGVWRKKHTHEQAVFNEYLRYDYPDEIKILSCTEANRYPGSGDCEGEFISHYWPFKDMIPGGVKEAMAQYFWPSLQKAYSQDRADVIVRMEGDSVRVGQVEPQPEAQSDAELS